MKSVKVHMTSSIGEEIDKDSEQGGEQLVRISLESRPSFPTESNAFSKSGAGQNALSVLPVIKDVVLQTENWRFSGLEVFEAELIQWNDRGVVPVEVDQ